MTGPISAAPKRHGDRQILMLIIIGIFLLKLTLFFLFIPRFTADLKSIYSIGGVDSYVTIAKNIANGVGYRILPDTSLTLYREPGYPYFLAALRYVFHDQYKTAAIVSNILFTSICAWLIFNLAGRFISAPWVSVIAPILFMVHPAVTIAELRFGPEIPFTMLLLAFLLLLDRALSAGSTYHYARAGIALGVLSCVRSTALLFPTFLIIHGFLFNGGWSSIFRSLSKIVLILGCALLVLSPWITRNYMLVGKFIPTTSIQGAAMHAGYYICTHEGTGMQVYELDEESTRARNRLAAEQGYRFKPDWIQLFFDPHDEVKFNSWLASEVVDQHVKSPSVFIKCSTENVLNFWFRGKTLSVTIVNICIQTPFLALALIGIVVGLRQMYKPTFGLLMLYILYTMAVYVPVLAEARYSMPLVPILAIFAAIPVGRLVAWRLRSEGEMAIGPMPAP